MFFVINKLLIFLFIFFANSCSLSEKNIIKNDNVNLISIETPNDKHNILFKVHLDRNFQTNKDISAKFFLKSNLSFKTSNTLSSGSSNYLKKTIGIVNYKLYDLNTNKLIKSGMLSSFPIIGSTSNSLYSNEVGIKHSKERLNTLLSLKLYNHINVILRSLN